MNEKISQIVISRSTVDIRYITGNRCGGKVFQKARESVDLKVW
jgi:DNA-directed RNA polymerase subunit RPC12/RpoP